MFGKWRGRFPAWNRLSGFGCVFSCSLRPPRHGNVAVRAPVRARGYGAGRRARCRCVAERVTALKVRVLHARAWNSEVSRWLQCIQVRAESRSRLFLKLYSFSRGEEVRNREILILSRRTLDNRRKLQRTERIDCAIAVGVDTLCKDRAGKAPVADLSSNQGPPFQAGTVPFRVDEDRIGGSAIYGTLANFVAHPLFQGKQFCTTATSCIAPLRFVHSALASLVAVWCVFRAHPTTSVANDLRTV